MDNAHGMEQHFPRFVDGLVHLANDLGMNIAIVYTCAGHSDGTFHHNIGSNATTERDHVVATMAMLIAMLEHSADLKYTKLNRLLTELVGHASEAYPNIHIEGENVQ